MSAKHTPGQLVVRSNGGDWSASYDGDGCTAYMGIVNDQDTTIALAVAHSTNPWNEPEGPDEDARRLVACWNACEGISTDALESKQGMPLIVSFQREQDRADLAARQRDELLAALRPFASVDLRTQGVHQRFADDVLRARAAIANVTGGAPA